MHTKQILIRYLVAQIVMTDLRIAVLVFRRRLALHPTHAMPWHLLAKQHSHYLYEYLYQIPTMLCYYYYV